NPDLARSLSGLPVGLNPPEFTGSCGQSSRLEESGGPKPLVHSHRGHDLFSYTNGFQRGILRFKPGNEIIMYRRRRKQHLGLERRRIAGCAPSLDSGPRTTIYYKDWGKGQPIVFSHGWPLTADDWDGQMLFFGQRGYRVIAADRRGHGRSGQTWDGNDM